MSGLFSFAGLGGGMAGFVDSIWRRVGRLGF